MFIIWQIWIFWNIHFKTKNLHCFRDILSICQLHILLSRTAQIYLELHFCVELHTKKALATGIFLWLLCNVLRLWSRTIQNATQVCVCVICVHAITCLRSFRLFCLLPLFDISAINHTCTVKSDQAAIKRLILLLFNYANPCNKILKMLWTR